MDSPYLPLFPALSQGKGTETLLGGGLALKGFGEACGFALELWRGLGTHSVSLVIPAG